MGFGVGCVIGLSWLAFGCWGFFGYMVVEKIQPVVLHLWSSYGYCIIRFGYCFRAAINSARDCELVLAKAVLDYEEMTEYSIQVPLINSAGDPELVLAKAVLDCIRGDDRVLHTGTTHNLSSEP